MSKSLNVIELTPLPTEILSFPAPLAIVELSPATLITSSLEVAVTFQFLEPTEIFCAKLVTELFSAA